MIIIIRLTVGVYILYKCHLSRGNTRSVSKNDFVAVKQKCERFSIARQNGRKEGTRTGVVIGIFIFSPGLRRYGHDSD